MQAHKLRLRKIFEMLDLEIAQLNRDRREDGSPLISKASVKILGQMSLLTNDEVAAHIDLFETADLDAFLETEFVVMKKLRELLATAGLIYDESSSDIWIPPNSRFEPLFDFTNIRVDRLDGESVLVSKAIKAKEKNRMLIQEAIASEIFPGLADRIQIEGGDLKYFLETDQ